MSGPRYNLTLYNNDGTPCGKATFYFNPETNREELIMDRPTMTARGARKMAGWFSNNTSYKRSGGTPYECAIEALNAYADRLDDGNDPRVPDEAPKVPKLTERQAQTLYLIHRGDLKMVNPRRNVKVIDQLIKLGTLDDWRNVTDLGAQAVAKYLTD